MLDDESAAFVVAVGADAVEGEDEGVAKLADVATQPQRGGVGQVGAGDRLRRDGLRAERAEGAGDGSVGTDERIGGAKAKRAEDTHGVGMAAAGGDDNLDAGGFRGHDGGKIARADVAVVAEECAVHVDSDEANCGGAACLRQTTPLPYPLAKVFTIRGLAEGSD